MLLDRPSIYYVRENLPPLCQQYSAELKPTHVLLLLSSFSQVNAVNTNHQESTAFRVQSSSQLQEIR